MLSSCSGGGGDGSLGSVSFDSKEQRIINEGRVGGTILGAVLGAVVGNNSKLGTERGAAIGAGLGFITGDQIGKKQAKNARTLRLKNAQLSSALAELRSNNDRLEAYNRKVAARIAELRRQTAAKRAAMAKADLRSIDKTIKKSETYTEEAAQVEAKLIPSQASVFSASLQPYVQNQNQLVSYRNEVEQMTLASAEE